MRLFSRDRYSNLPDHLISHILSFLPTTKEAVSTSVLSKKWRYLFGSVTNINFDMGFEYNYIQTSFMDFVERVLYLLGSGTVNKFSLSCRGYGVDPVCMKRWILNVLKRGVSDFDIRLTRRYGCPLPLELFVSKTLVKLKLGHKYGPNFTLSSHNVFLPKLKSLYLGSLDFQELSGGFPKLLSGCPMLEELVMMNICRDFRKSCSISAVTLKRLIFLCEDWDRNPKSVSFDTLNLVYLEYTDTIAYKYPKVCFDSLIEAHIDLRPTTYMIDGAYISEDSSSSESEEEKGMVGNATYFFKGIRNVKILSLSPQTLEVLKFCCEATLVFNNLRKLTIESNSAIGWESLSGLLMNCPRLEVLVMKGLHHTLNDGCGNVCCCKRLENVPSCLLSSPVKVLKIFLYGNDNGSGNDIRQIKYFLEKMPRLEHVLVYINTSNDHHVSELCNKLQKIRGIASPKCKIQVRKLNERRFLSDEIVCS